MGQVLDYVEENIHKMMELLHFLIKEEVTGKIIYSTLFYLITLYSEHDTKGVSGKSIYQVISETNPNASSQKRIKFFWTITKEPNVEEFKLSIDFLMEDINLKLKQGNIEEKEGEL